MEVFMVQKSEGEKQQSERPHGNRNYENKRNFRDSKEGQNRGGVKDNSYRNRNNQNNDRNDRSERGSYNNESKYQNRNQSNNNTRVRLEETVEDIRIDNSRIEKEIQLMISEIKNMKL
jgi:hypothetical protein